MEEEKPAPMLSVEDEQAAQAFLSTQPAASSFDDDEFDWDDSSGLEKEGNNNTGMPVNEKEVNEKVNEITEEEVKRKNEEEERKREEEELKQTKVVEVEDDCDTLLETDEIGFDFEMEETEGTHADEEEKARRKSEEEETKRKEEEEAKRKAEEKEAKRKAEEEAKRKEEEEEAKRKAEEEEAKRKEEEEAKRKAEEEEKGKEEEEKAVSLLETDEIGVEVDNSDEIKELQKEEAVWEELDQMETARQDALQKVGGPSIGIQPKIITEFTIIGYREVLDEFRSLDLKEELARIVAVHPPSGCFPCIKAMLLGRMAPELVDERDRMFAWALIPLNRENTIHERLLQSVFMKLTASKRGCPKYGDHWIDIGFQGSDPSTDIRGAGMLGLLQLLRFTTKHGDYAAKIFRLSRDEQQNFPFAVVGLNMTKITLETLRKGKLTRLCNKENNVVDVVNDFYMGCYHRLYTVWRREHKTISDFGFVLKDLTNYAQSHASNVVKDFRKFVSQPIIDLPEEVEFTNL